MSLTFSSNKLKIWQNLEQMANPKFSLMQAFKENPNRVQDFLFPCDQLSIDCSKDWLDADIQKQLIQLANTSNLQEGFRKLLNAEVINSTENQAATHAQLRAAKDYLSFEKLNSKLFDAVKKFRGNQWLGANKTPLTQILHIGIGGSDLGPRLLTHALKPLTNHTQIQWVSNLDEMNFKSAIQNLNPAQTLLIISSKSFSTEETQINFNRALQWFENNGFSREQVLKYQTVAITNKIQIATDLGIQANHVLEIPQSVGGRYSIWSAIAFPACLIVGLEPFFEFLEGGKAIDQLIKKNTIENNTPALLGLLSCWYRNFHHAQTRAVIAYDHRLKYLVDYLQQLIMESNGKSVDIQGNPIGYETAEIVWGGMGTMVQHSFHQMLHQGTGLVPIDFIVPLENTEMLAHALAQSHTLMSGHTGFASDAEQIKHQKISGNKPSTLWVYNHLTPRVLGNIIATYEYKVFTQSQIWNINPFDQWGVEAGKKMASQISASLKNPQVQALDTDPSTDFWIAKHQQK
jgi:glucose-6-phosphate isomerase